MEGEWLFIAMGAVMCCLIIGSSLDHIAKEKTKQIELIMQAAPEDRELLLLALKVMYE